MSSSASLGSWHFVLGLHVQLDLDLNLKLGVVDLDLNLKLGVVDLDLNLKLGVSFRSSCASTSRSRPKTKFGVMDFQQLYEPFYLFVKSSPNLVVS